MGASSGGFSLSNAPIRVSPDNVMEQLLLGRSLHHHFGLVPDYNKVPIINTNARLQIMPDYIFVPPITALG